MTTTLINIDIACNDEHGHREPSAPFFDFEAGEHHVGLAGGPIDVMLTMGALIVAGQSYQAHGRESHVGNVCWERAVLTLEDARRLMRQLFEAGWDLDEWTEASPFHDVLREAGHDV